MKKVLYLMGLLVALMFPNTMVAQNVPLLNHLSIGGEVGTAGCGLELAVPCTRYLTLRAGFTAMPRFSYTEKIGYRVKGVDYEAKVKGELHMSDWKLLADIYPFKGSSFHLTTGFYAGQAHVLQVSNTDVLQGISSGDGIELGGKAIFPAANGRVFVQTKTNALKPYVGLGLGRPISRKNKVSCAFDLGVQFWGTPVLQAYSADSESWIDYRKEELNDKDLNDAFQAMETLTVYPVLNFRIYFNAF